MPAKLPFTLLTDAEVRVLDPDLAHDDHRVDGHEPVGGFLVGGPDHVLPDPDEDQAAAEVVTVVPRGPIYEVTYWRKAGPDGG